MMALATTNSIHSDTPSSINRQINSSDEATLIAGEIQAGISNVIWSTGAPKRHCCYKTRSIRFIVILAKKFRAPEILPLAKLITKVRGCFHEQHASTLTSQYQLQKRGTLN